jgi:ankyrin repeat protein
LLQVVDSTDKAGFSPFMYAVMHGHLVVAQYLRAVKARRFLVLLFCYLIFSLQGLNVNRADWNGNTPLHLAAMWGRSKAMIDFLIHDCNASVDEQDENGATPLHHAAFNGHKETVVALCNLQAMVSAEDRDGSSPLLLALMQNHSDIARYLKDDKKADIGSFNSRGDTCLWATIQNHNDELMNVLLKDQRTDLSRKLGHFDFTLLMRCLLQLDHALCDKIVGVILSQKPDVNITNKLGMTALYYAVAMDRPNMVTFLTMACGALVRVKDKSGNTPLHFCGNEGITKTLIANGAGQQVNLPNAQGNTPLHAAFAFGGPAVADVLLSAGGDMTRKNNDGLTPADCVLVDQKYITLPFYEQDSHYEHTIFIGAKLATNTKK